MKTSMKLMVMTLVVAMLLSMSAFAASVTYTSFASEEGDAEDYDVTVTYGASDFATGDQVTLLVLIGSDEITWEDQAETIPANILYIDQEAIEGATGTFEFSIAKSTIDEYAEKGVYVKLGATGFTNGAPATSGDEPIEDFVGGSNTEGTVLDSTNATVTDVTAGTETSSVISAVYTVAITDAALTGKVPQAYVGETAVGTVFFSTERNKYLVVLPAGTEGDVSIKAVDAASVSVTNFIYGDTNGDGQTAPAEVNMATAQVKTTQTPINTAARVLALDVSGDGNISAADINQLTAKVKGALTVYPITSR